MKNAMNAYDLLEQFLEEDEECIASAEYNYAMIVDAFSIAIAEYRQEKELSQTQTANELGISQAMLSQYENGCRNFSIKTMCEMCEKLKIIPNISFSMQEKKHDTAGDGIQATIDLMEIGAMIAA